MRTLTVIGHGDYYDAQEVDAEHAKVLKMLKRCDEALREEANEKGAKSLQLIFDLRELIEKWEA